MIFSFYPNLFSENSFTDFKSVNVRNYNNKNFDYYEIKDDSFSDLGISSVTALSYSQFQKNFPEYHFSEAPKFDAIFGIPFLLENSLTINFKQKTLGFNKSSNNAILPYRKVNEKLSEPEKVGLASAVENPFATYTINNQKDGRGKYAIIKGKINGIELTFVFDTGCLQSVLFKNGKYKIHAKTIDREADYRICLPELQIDDNKLQNVYFECWNTNNFL